MTDREHLIDLLHHRPWLGTTEQIADYLLANGVIVPPCKVGDTVYSVGVFTGQIIENKVVGIHYDESEIFLFVGNGTVVTVGQQLGKTVFLTKEEAEEKLKEMNNK